MELEQEIASIMAVAQCVAGGINYYYWNLPEDFHFPALFFPQPEVTTGGDTFHSYASEYSWYIKAFAQTTEQAHSIALSILTALKQAKNYVPLLNEDGNPTGKKLRLKDPSLKRLDGGIVQITIEWTSRRPYNEPQPPKMRKSRFRFINIKKEDLPDGEKDDSRPRWKCGGGAQSFPR